MKSELQIKVGMVECPQFMLIRPDSQSTCLNPNISLHYTPIFYYNNNPKYIPISLFFLILNQF